MSSREEKENKGKRWFNNTQQEWTSIGFIKDGYIFRWHEFQYFLWIEEEGS